MIKKSLLFTILALFLLLSTNTVESLDSAMNEKKLTILFTHDQHSNLMGYARAKTLMDEIQWEVPQPLIVDGGDFSMGTLYQTIYQESAIELRALGLMGYDAISIGNHEFDYRGKGFAKMLNSALDSGDRLPPVLLSNVNWYKSLSDPTLSPGAVKSASNIKEAFDRLNIKEYEIIEKNGVRVAVFSLLGKEADSYAPLSGLSFTDPIEKAKEIVADIKAKENVDLILCLSHSGTNKKLKKSEDHRLAREVKEIDVIISAHSHTLFREVQFEGTTAIVSIGSNGRRLGRLDVAISQGAVTVENYNAIPLDSNIIPDKEVTALMKNAKKQVQDSFLKQYNYQFDQVLAYNPYRFTPYVTFAIEQQEYPLGNIVSDSYIYAVEQAEGENYEPIDVSIALSGGIRASLNRGEITVADAFKVSSLGVGKDGITGYPLVAGYLTGKDLKSIAEIDASISTLMPSTQLFMSGLSYTFNPNRMLLNRVVEVKLEKSPGVYEEIQDDKLYRIVTGLFATQMLHTLDEKSKGLLSILPKDKDGKVIGDYEDFIVQGSNGEVKEWLSLASYLESFEKVDGLPTIPEKYKDPQGRKIVNEDHNVLSIIEKPNKVFLGLVAVSATLLCALAMLARFIRRKFVK